MNPMQMLKMLMGKSNPKQIVTNFIKNNSNPMVSNLVEMANRNDVKGLEEFARNMCNERGVDFDKEINNFMSNFR